MFSYVNITLFLVHLLFQLPVPPIHPLLIEWPSVTHLHHLHYWDQSWASLVMDRQYQQPVRVMDNGHQTLLLTSVYRVRCILTVTIVVSSLLTALTCGPPTAPPRGSVDVSGQSAPFSLGSKVKYCCNEGLFPSDERTSTCTDVEGRGEWVMDPGSLVCREIPG